MKNMVEKAKTLLTRYREVLMYLIFGVLTTLVNFVIYFVLVWLNVNYLLSNAIAIALSILFAYVTNRKWVFESKATSLKEISVEFVSFVSCRLLSSLYDMLSMFVLVSLLHADEFLAKVITGVIVVILNYVFSKWLVFRSKKEEQ